MERTLQHRSHMIHLQRFTGTAFMLSGPVTIPYTLLLASLCNTLYLFRCMSCQEVSHRSPLFLDTSAYVNHNIAVAMEASIAELWLEFSQLLL
jgi:hypothetical protein